LCKHQPRCDVIPSTEIETFLLELDTSASDTAAFSLDYYPGLDLQTMLSNLENNHQADYRRRNSPKSWIVGETLSDVILPQDKVHYSYNSDIGDTFGYLQPLRWKRELTAKKYKFLMPRCYMCQRRQLSFNDGSKRRALICDECTRINEEKRSQRCDLHGKIALLDYKISV